MNKKNIFFKKIDKVSLEKICEKIKIKNPCKKNTFIYDVKSLEEASINDLTFLHSNKYINLIPYTKSNFVLTSNKFKKYFTSKNLLLVDNILPSLATITEIFYPESLNENFEKKKSIEIKKKNLKMLK